MEFIGGFLAGISLGLVATLLVSRRLQGEIQRLLHEREQSEAARNLAAQQPLAPSRNLTMWDN